MNNINAIKDIRNIKVLRNFMDIKKIKDICNNKDIREFKGILNLKDFRISRMPKMLSTSWILVIFRIEISI